MASASVISLESSTLTVSSAQLCLLSFRLCLARRAGGKKQSLLALPTESADKSELAVSCFAF